MLTQPLSGLGRQGQVEAEKVLHSQVSPPLFSLEANPSMAKGCLAAVQKLPGIAAFVK